MTDKEKIRAEIVDRINCYKGSEVNFHNRISELENILAFIDSMQEEHDEIVDKYLYGKEPELVDADDLPKEEPVSEELEEVAKEWLRPQLDKSYANYGEVKMMELIHFDGYAMLDAIEFGANWQKTKDESATDDLGEYINELSKQFPEVSFAKLSRIAVRVAKWQIEQIKEALLSEVLPCFMHGGEADEVVAKLDEVLNQKK